MKFNLKFIVAFVIMVALLIGTPSRASANIFVGSYNTGNITYAFAGVYSSSYQDQLASYFKQWDAVTTKITMTKAATYSSAKLKLLYKLEAPPQANLFGQTYLYSSSGTQLAAPGGTWVTAKCTIYNTSNTETANKATLVHEVGHALSMAHCLDVPGHGSVNHIMHQGVKNYITLSTYEKYELIKKWGK
jgi:hypothetical protein